MSKDWSKTVATAVRLVGEYGRDVTLAKLVETPKTEGEPWRGSTVPPALDTAAPTLTLKGVATGLMKSLGDDFLKGIDNVIVVAGDFEVRGFDIVIDGESRWRIIKSQTLAPGTTKILHFLGVVH